MSLLFYEEQTPRELYERLCETLEKKDIEMPWTKDYKTFIDHYIQTFEEVGMVLGESPGKIYEKFIGDINFISDWKERYGTWDKWKNIYLEAERFFKRVEDEYAELVLTLEKGIKPVPLGYPIR